MTWMLSLLMFAATDPITDEALRLEALRAIFPKMPVVAVPGKRVKAPIRDWKSEIGYPNALAGEQIYRVTGEARNKTEHCNANDYRPGPNTNVREVAFRLYSWPGSSTDFAAIVQYAFPGSLPAMSCSSIGLIAHLSRRFDKLTQTEQFVMDPTHHSAIIDVQLLDLTGDGIEDLVVESDFGSRNAWVFDARLRSLKRTTNQTTRDCVPHTVLS